MQGTATETVGDQFQQELLERARDRTLEVILEASARILPGTTEAEAKKIVQEIQARLGGEKSWHPPQIRFGENSVLPFGKQGLENVALKEDDIYFLDIGPVFGGHEGDVGRTFVLGNDPEMRRCRQDAEEIWRLTRDRWNQGVKGPDLYSFASAQAEARGWRLLLEKANGHRIADFPHAARARGSVENFTGVPAPNRWILEIQIRHPEKPFGAFYEDLLS
jgi:Xaa-Pro aminopeptidase